MSSGSDMEIPAGERRGQHVLVSFVFMAFRRWPRTSSALAAGPGEFRDGIAGSGVQRQMGDRNYTSWAGQATLGFDALERVHRGLTVELIMTPRCSLMTCRREDSIRDVMSRNTGMYSYLPVVDEAGVILGPLQGREMVGKGGAGPAYMC